MAEYRDEQYADAADFLVQNKADIVQCWARQVRTQMPRARNRPLPLLRHSVPLFLDVLAPALKSERAVSAESLANAAISELNRRGSRASSCWMQEVVHEYAILHRILLEQMEPHVVLSFAQRDALTESVFNAMQAAAADYARGIIISERAVQAGANAELETMQASVGILESSLCKEREAASEAHKEIDELHLEGSHRDAFVATLSHDLRNPLIVARASALRILRHPGKDNERLMHCIVASLDRAETMIRDLLDVTQIHAGHKLLLMVKEGDLRAMIDTALADLAVVHGDRFVLDAPQTLPGAWDCDAVRRAIENLAINAVKYGAADTPVQIRVKECGDTVEIAVQNQGNPLQAGEMQGLFDPFHRTPGARSSGKRGWGLGLSLVRSIVEAHGGSIRVSSGQETGTVFTITLPRFAHVE